MIHLEELDSPHTATSQAPANLSEPREEEACSLCELHSHALHTLDCGCRVCAQCIAGWAEAVLSGEYGAGAPLEQLRCPMNQEHPVMPYTLVASTLNEAQLASLERALARAALGDACTVCPHCDGIGDSGGLTRVECHRCGACYGQDSGAFGLGGSASGALSWLASSAWKSVMTSPCPACRAPILKNGGCQHMTCLKCGESFCWLCKMPSRSHCCFAGLVSRAAPWVSVLALLLSQLFDLFGWTAWLALLPVTHFPLIVACLTALVLSKSIRHAQGHSRRPRPRMLTVLCAALGCAWGLHLLTPFSPIALAAWLLQALIVYGVPGTLLTSIAYVQLVTRRVHLPSVGAVWAIWMFVRASRKQALRCAVELAAMAAGVATGLPLDQSGVGPNIVSATANASSVVALGSYESGEVIRGLNII
eukprot:TRINITY_DN16271_c0_g1_i1.p1 TRINITY_DN16271_c0_g1~~TRINITY_DN16271_c0_g1_i1.p1  ORF type:complete len:420 (-),score=59.13 TRINITY_DN16271_c0_g1_i1:144-1403(-)